MITSAFKARAQEVAKLKEASIKILFLLFLNTGLWLAGTFLFMHLEGTNEAEHKCGVKKVQRDFIENLWHESQSFDEFEWKSSARQKILNFENQIYEAVEAGVSSTSGQKVWSIPNTFVYVFTMSTTIGYGHLTPGNPSIRLVSILYALVSIPLLSSLVSHLATAISSLITIMSLSWSNLDTLVNPSMMTPSLSSLTMVLTMVLTTGSLLFSLLFSWELDTSLYFVFSSVSTVGFGDVIPADSLMFLMSGGFILIGLAVFSLWQDAVMNGLDFYLSKLVTRRRSEANGKVKHD